MHSHQAPLHPEEYHCMAVQTILLKGFRMVSPGHMKLMPIGVLEPLTTLQLCINMTVIFQTASPFSMTALPVPKPLLLIDVLSARLIPPVKTCFAIDHADLTVITVILNNIQDLLNGFEDHTFDAFFPEGSCHICSGALRQPNPS